MPQLHEGQTKKLLGQVDERFRDDTSGARGGTDGFAEILSVNGLDPEEKAARLTRMMDDMIRRAEASLEKSDELYRSLGIDRETTRRYLAGDKFSPEARREIEAKLQAYHDEIMRDVQADVSRAKAEMRGGRRTTGRPKTGRIRV